MRRIYEVKTADVFLIKSSPPEIAVTATGLVPTTGWTRPELSRRVYVTPPSDGIQDLDFNAEEPTERALPVLTPIAAALVIDRDPANYWGKGKTLTGVRVHATSNHVEAKLDQARTIEFHQLAVSARAAAASSGGDQPFPFKVGMRIDVGASVGELLGRTLRVYRTGDLLTQDYRRDRANIELDPGTSRIVDVWIG